MAIRQDDRYDPAASVHPARIRDNRHSDAAGLLSLAVGVVIVAALYVAHEVLVPIALAILLSFMLAPVVRLLRRARLGRVPAVVLAVALALGIIVSLGGLIGTQFSQLLSDLPRYATTIEQKILRVRGLMVGEVAGSLGSLGHRIEQASSVPVAPAAGPAPAVAVPAPPPEVVVRQPAPTPLEIAERVLAPILSPLATAGIVFIVAIFMLLQQADLRDRFIRLFGMQDLHRTTRALDDAAARLSRYFLTQLGLNTAFGMIIGGGLLLVGVPNPLLWGTLAALLRFVPYIGTFISGSLPTALAAAVDPGWSMAIWTASLFLVTETVMGQFVDPLAYGKSTGLSPVSVVIAAIFWAWMWGPIGLILSMPLTVCLVVLGRHVQKLEFLDVLMGDRPALTPVESFYQRILANDPDEAQDQAEILLKDCALSTYYDEVAIQGLQLVAQDAERGVLSGVQLERIEQAMARLIGELGAYGDTIPASAKPRTTQTSGLDKPELEPPAEAAPSDPAAAPAGSLVAVQPPVSVAPPVRDETPTQEVPANQPASVLCVCGRGMFDAIASDMLVQVLGKNGLAARAEPYEATSRAQIASLEIAGIAMICISSLEITASPSHLRYLVRRLRDRAPLASILVGLFPLEETALDDRFGAAVGADFYATSLRDTVNFCLALNRAERDTPPAELPYIGAEAVPA